MSCSTSVLAMLILSPMYLSAQSYVNAQLPWHEAVFDSQGKLLAWHNPEKHQGYDKFLRLAWDFMEHKVPADPGSKLKVYLINAVYNPVTLQGANWQGNPASTFGQFVDSLVAWYPYSADEEAIRVVREMLDHQLSHGTSPADWAWPSVPFATNCMNEPDYGRCLRGLPQEFYGGIETDKVGELGIGYARFYEMTGNRKYLEGAIHCADALATHVRQGDADHTPWPFRLDARTGHVVNAEEYGGMIVAPVRLLAELVRLKEGNTQKYQQARDMAWHWILKHPLNPGSPAWDKWSGYFEDVPKRPGNVNQALPTMTAYYILTTEDPPSVDREWQRHVAHLIDWVRARFGRGPYFGAWAIDEQGTPDGRGCCSRAGLASATSRWAAINALLYEKAHDAQAREDAYRSLNYATYFASNDGKIACCGLDYSSSYWFDDGYGDTVRNFMWAMGAIPEFAPDHENHLLWSSSVVQSVEYGERSISYRTFDGTATDVLRLTYRPATIAAGLKHLRQLESLNAEGFAVRPLPNGDFVVRIRRQEAKDVRIF